MWLWIFLVIETIIVSGFIRMTKLDEQELTFKEIFGIIILTPVIVVICIVFLFKHLIEKICSREKKEKIRC